MHLRECFDKLDANLAPLDKATIRASSKKDLIRFHHSLGRWIRNECRLWADGTADVQEDIQKILDAGYVIHKVEDTLLRKIAEGEDEGIDYSLNHPDNASGVILDLYHDYLNGKFDLSILD